MMNHTENMTAEAFATAKLLSPRRKTSDAKSLEALSREQLVHFGIDPDSEFGENMYSTALSLYRAQADVSQLWEITQNALDGLDRKDRIARFNAKKFLCFQLAKVLDTLQASFRKSYQGLEYGEGTTFAKGPYPIFDNVTALFSANPVVVRTATYIYACTEWVDDAFQGREFLHEIYSRLLNPTSVSLANHIVDVEAGAYAAEYLAWNYNSGMAAIDGLLSCQLRAGDILIASRNVYGGTYQLLHDFYARKNGLAVNLEFFDGYAADEYAAFQAEVEQRYAAEMKAGARILVYIESPCNPFGYVLDVPGICRIAHAKGHLVAHDSTVGTPFLNRPLQREDKRERPDFVIHSYTKDLIGNGNATAGVVIGENHRMFLPKGESMNGVSWDDTMFWSVYYIKGAFLDSEKAFEVLSGMKTVEQRMLQKCINTLVLSRFFHSHPQVNVDCNAVEGNVNFQLREQVLKFGLPAPLFTIDFEAADLDRESFVSFFDNLSPGLDHQVSLGQSNTVVLCPAMTSHSELDEQALADAGICQTTIRVAVGLENPKEVIAHFVNALKLGVELVRPGFTECFMSPVEIDRLVEETYLNVHAQFIRSGKSAAALID